MQIYLLRHARSVANERKLVCGAADYPLSEYGKNQALEIGNILNEINFSKVYSSPLSRALQTIQYLTFSSSISIEPELIELNTGEVSHMNVEVLWEKEPRYKNQGLNANLKYPNGECLNDMLNRISSWYKKKVQCWNDSDVILIVGHEGTVCGILHHLLKLRTINYPTFVLNNCDMVKIVISSDRQMRISLIPYSSR